jgi:hypothetical protein
LLVFMSVVRDHRPPDRKRFRLTDPETKMVSD